MVPIKAYATYFRETWRKVQVLLLVQHSALFHRLQLELKKNNKKNTKKKTQENSMKNASI